MISLRVCSVAFLGLGLALANTTTLDCLKKYFTSKRPLAMCINKVGIILGGLASENWVEVLFGAVGFSGTWLVWSGMFVAILFLKLRVFGNPEDYFISETKEVPIEDTLQVEDDEVVESANIFVRFWRLLMGKMMGFGFLVKFVLVVAICITLGFGNSCFTSSAARRANAIDLGTDDAGWIPIIAIFGELAGTLVYGLAARRSPFPHFAEYSASLFVEAVCAGVPHLCGVSFWLLVIFSILGGVANGVLKVVPVLVFIENHGVGNLVGTLNVLKMFDGISKLLYPLVACVPILAKN